MLVSLSRYEKVKYIDENEVRNVWNSIDSQWKINFFVTQVYDKFRAKVILEGYSRFVELRMESAHLCPAKHTIYVKQSRALDTWRDVKQSRALDAWRDVKQSRALDTWHGVWICVRSHDAQLQWARTSLIVINRHRKHTGTSKTRT